MIKDPLNMKCECKTEHAPRRLKLLLVEPMDEQVEAY